jgi:hypothetical protein
MVCPTLFLYHAMGYDWRSTGVYCVLFASCMHILVFNRKGKLKVPLLAVSLALFVCITIVRCSFPLTRFL